jgi:hypothetical protein
MLSADLISLFEGTLHGHLILAFFIPGVVYLADAVGTQTETLVIRGMSVGISIEKVFWREVATGLLVGLTLAVVLFPLVLWHWERADVAAPVALVGILELELLSDGDTIIADQGTTPLFLDQDTLRTRSERDANSIGEGGGPAEDLVAGF